MAWNSFGHRLAAELAWRRLDATERQAATALLKQHPHYETILAAHVPAGVDKDEWVFLTAANWPDLIRPVKNEEPPKPESVTKYNVYPHGVAFPLVLAANQGEVSLDGYVLPMPNAQTGLADSIATFGNPQASAHDRAVSLCWVLHLGADLLQPLHAAILVSPENPKGGSFGSELAAREGNAKPVPLHIYWDNLPGKGSDYATIAAQTDVLEKSPEFAPANLPELKTSTTVAAWAEDSHRIAVTFAYAGELRYGRWADFAAGKIAAEAVPALPPDYCQKARQIARRQLALAGWRIADVLKRVW